MSKRTATEPVQTLPIGTEKIDSDVLMDDAKRPKLPPLSGEAIKNQKNLVEGHKIPIPRNRIKPLKENWMQIYNPIVEQLKLQIRYNTKTSHVEVRTAKSTTDLLAVQRAADFVRAFALGFEVGDALSLKIALKKIYYNTRG